MTRAEALGLLGLGPQAQPHEIDAAIAREYRLWSNRTNAPDFEARTHAQRRVAQLGEAETLLLGDRRARGQSAPAPRPATGTAPAPMPHGGPPAWQPPVPGQGPDWSRPWSGHGQAQPPPPSWGPPANPAPPQSGYQPSMEREQYYERAFAGFEAGGSKVQWNWAAFFFSLLWYLFNGMWVKSLILAGVLVISGGAFWIPIAIYSGLMGNYDYYLLKRRGTQGW
jgi:hypothetical protein